MTVNDKYITFEAETMPHQKSIMKTATRLAVNRNDAEDLAQETFMQAWKAFEKYEAGTNCRAWLFQILMHKSAHQNRKHFMKMKHFQEVDEFVFEIASVAQPTPEHLTNPEIIKAVNKIPAHYRAVVLLVDMREFSYKEVANALNIPIGTVMSRLNRGREYLRKILGKTIKKDGAEYKNEIDYFLQRYT